MEESFNEFERSLLLNISTLQDKDKELFSKQILNGEYEAVLNNEFFSTTIFSFTNENIQENIYMDISTNRNNHKMWFCAGVASISYFIQNNWTGPFKKEDIQHLLWLRKTATSNLSLNDQCNDNVVKPELLYLAKLIFCNNQLQISFPTCIWWLLRINHIHQLILEETTGILFDELENLLKQFSALQLLNDDTLKTLFNIEVAHYYIFYTRVQSSEKYLENARILAKLNIELEGALGKRTKYQQKEKAQLYLKANVDKDLFPYRACETLPKVINLSDDLRLEKIEFTEETQKAELGSFEEAIIMTKFFQLQLSRPKDLLTDEEIVPYLDCIIENTKNWALKISALFQRCILESNHKRTIDRSLAQIEYLIEQLNSSKTSLFNRMDLFFASGMRPSWILKQHLANLMLNIGMVKGALEIFLSLFLWEDVIVCYTILEMKSKAAEIIRQELAKKPSVKLWCLLGDATQEVEHYETAWKLSGEKSSRVQRHWGLYYYSKQNYQEAVPHLKLSVELNNIQENVWVRLGFAALQIEDWKLAASAYRKYCALEQSNFEAWNNLAKAYIKLGDKSRAWRSLQDAIKCNFDKWEVWDNLMIVSIDLGHFSEVIRCYHRLLDIKGSHVDVQILSILSKAIMNELKDSNGNSAKKYLHKALELFGRLTALVTTNSDIWRLYAELTLSKDNHVDNEKAAQFFQRAYRAAVSNPRWFKNVEDLNKVLDTCIRLAKASIKCTENGTVSQKKAILGSVKLPLQSVTKKIKDLMWENQSEISENLNKIEYHLNIVLAELEKLKNIEK